jgi:hypothetical protein
VHWHSSSCERANFISTKETRWLRTTIPRTRCDAATFKATTWENTSEKDPFFSTTVFRLFKDQSGAWRKETSFDLNDDEQRLEQNDRSGSLHVLNERTEGRGDTNSLLAASETASLFTNGERGTGESNSGASSGIP